MSRIPIRPLIVVEAHPKEIDKNAIIQISARLFDKKNLQLQQVSRIFMTITSMTSGKTVWPLEVIRKNSSGFDIGIGTQEMQAGEEYLVRVSNNWNLSPSASTTFTIKESEFPPAAVLLPIIFSPLFIRKYQDKGIQNTDELVEYLKSQGMTDEQIQKEVERILREVDLEEDLKIPIDITRKVVSKQWITQMDRRVCPLCEEASASGPQGNGTWDWDDPDAPEIPRHPNCRCTYELTYENDRTSEFRGVATMAQLDDIEMLEDAIAVIKELQ